MSPLGEALSWRNELPDDRLLVTVGFKREEIEDSKFPLARLGEPIILCEPDTTNTKYLATASFVNNPAFVTCKDILPVLEKSFTRSSLRKLVQIRSPASADEWAGYFALRYRVWEECNYLRDENKCARTKWEIDWKDRTAIPLCAITPAGKVVGCARLLHGQEEHRYVSQINALLIGTGDDILQRLFNFPHRATLPFDLLTVFPSFGERFRDLITKRKKPAEISRVAVDPEYRRRYIAEALVDTAVSLAKARRFAPIFLACQERHARLYGKCGFLPVEGLKSEKYLNIQLPSIVMEMQNS